LVIALRAFDIDVEDMVAGLEVLILFDLFGPLELDD
jgi:hypothetical protein